MSEKMPSQPSDEQSDYKNEFEKLKESGALDQVVAWIETKEPLWIYRERTKGWQKVTAYEIGHGGLSAGVTWTENEETKSKPVPIKDLIRWQAEAPKEDTDA